MENKIHAHLKKVAEDSWQTLILRDLLDEQITKIRAVTKIVFQTSTFIPLQKWAQQYINRTSKNVGTVLT